MSTPNGFTVCRTAFPAFSEEVRGCGIKPSTFSFASIVSSIVFFPVLFSFPLLYFLPSSTVSLGSFCLAFSRSACWSLWSFSFYPLFPEAPENTFSLLLPSLPPFSHLPPFFWREVSFPLEATTFSVSSSHRRAAAQRERRGKKEEKERERKKNPEA